MFQKISLKIKICAFIFPIVSMGWKIYYEVLEASTRESFHEYFIMQGYGHILKTLLIVCIEGFIIYMYSRLVSRYERE